MKTTKAKKKKKKSFLLRLMEWVHLWLGLISGVVVFVVSITGCIYVFQQDIKDALEPWRFVEAKNTELVPPSKLLDTAQKYMPEQEPTGLTYGNSQEAAAVGYDFKKDGKRNFTAVFVNPYSGELIKKEQVIANGKFDFFRFIIKGHRTLWLPKNTGKTIVGVSALLFVVLLFSGLVMWWPKKWSKANTKKSFKIKWKAKFRRLNLDLHNVLGFYALLIALVIGLTGLVWSFQWFEDSVYYVASAGDSKPEHQHPHSAITQSNQMENDSRPVLDRAWFKVVEQENDIQGMYLSPQLTDKKDPVEIVVFHDDETFYDKSAYYYDQYTLESLSSDEDSFSTASFATQLSMLNYDIHTGAVWGIAGKILVFLVSLISASLPVTGFLVWWKKKKKQRWKSLKFPRP